MLAQTVGQFFCIWRGFLLDEFKPEVLFKVQQQSLKGTERFQSMYNLQHKQVPQQVTSAHALIEYSQITKNSYVPTSHTSWKVKALNSVTRSHRYQDGLQTIYFSFSSFYYSILHQESFWVAFFLFFFFFKANTNNILQCFLLSGKINFCLAGSVSSYQHV